MLPKPTHFSAEYSAWFKDPLVIAAYPARPPYPEAVFQLLAALVVGEPRVVLDVGCGTGDLARRLAPLVERVDAVDFSVGMIELGRRLPGGAALNLHWINAAVEDAPLAPPYALVTAGESLHWMEWDVVLPRFAAALIPSGALAIVERGWAAPEPLRERMTGIFARYSPVRDYRPINLVSELEQRGLFETAGARTCGPEPWRPTVEEYLEARHSQRGFSRTHMGPATVAAFDDAIREALDDAWREGLLERHQGKLELGIEATVTWGRPVLRSSA